MCFKMSLKKNDIVNQAEPVRYGVLQARFINLSLCCSVGNYQRRLSWFHDTKFLKDLENDSIDSDIIDEELGVLQGANSLT